ncbi:hypothetical protein TH53_15730 [Pedobacter lusitanus]|uniref:Uncharacterized protein n=1 Tax=Pedobacter lusitanus TaxID=1503925 RepID=A0A0D0FV19_9SPHI|nr:hypothetical protein [Pedobacter lusitanus]KIO76299.1 hypothetical protein TH53_15730 [Pedobacter lusitanus]
METFLEFLFTASVTVFAGFLCLKYGPKTKRRARVARLKKAQEIRVAAPHKGAVLKEIYRNYSAKFILILIGATLFTGVFYLVDIGYVVIKW